MKLFVLPSTEEIHAASEEKVIPAKDFAVLKQASDILKKVKKEVKDYREEVEKECDALKEEAFKKGFDEGLAKLNEHIVTFDQKLKTLSSEIQKKILPIAIKAARKILGGELKLNPERIVDIVMQALKPVTQHHRITIYVNKEDLSVLEAKKSKMRKILQQVEIFSIQERSDIESGGCIIETEAGIINAQLENQWRALEYALKTFKKK